MTESPPPPGEHPAQSAYPAAHPGPHAPPTPPVSAASQAWLYAVLAVLLAAIIGGGVWWLRGQTTVDSLRVGDCLVSEDLAAGRPEVSSVDIVDCGESHDGEVVAGLVIDDATAEEGYSGRIGAQECAKVAGRVATLGLEVRPLAPDRDLVEGDLVPCIARQTDGTQIIGRLG